MCYYLFGQWEYDCLNGALSNPAPFSMNYVISYNNSCIQVSLGPLMLASKFVLVGDHYQLPPLVQVCINLSSVTPTFLL